MSGSKGGIAKTLLYVAVPSLVAGYLWWQRDDRGAEESSVEVEEEFKKKNIKSDQENNTTSSDLKSQKNTLNEKHIKLIESMKNACGKSSIIFAEVKESKDHEKGRGLFTTKQINEKNELFLKVRPSLTLLFEPYCYTHCLGCYSSLHQVPGRQCEECKRFAVRLRDRLDF